MSGRVDGPVSWRGRVCAVMADSFRFCFYVFPLCTNGLEDCLFGFYCSFCCSYIARGFDIFFSSCWGPVFYFLFSVWGGQPILPLECCVWKFSAIIRREKNTEKKM